MMHLGDIMSTVEGVQYRGGKILLFEYPTALNIPTVLKFQRMVSSRSTEYPHGTHDIPSRAS